MGPAMNDRRARTQRRGLHRGCPLRRSGWLEGATEYRYDVLILELMLRDQGDSTPIPVLTAKDGEYDETEALDSGADDYRTKPFSFPVLIARLRALLRRTSGGALAPTQVGDLRLDPARRRCWRGGGHELLVVHRMAATMLSPASTWQPWVAIRSTRPGRPGAPSSRTVTLRACQGQPLPGRKRAPAFGRGCRFTIANGGESYALHHGVRPRRSQPTCTSASITASRRRPSPVHPQGSASGSHPSSSSRLRLSGRANARPAGLPLFEARSPPASCFGRSPGSRRRGVLRRWLCEPRPTARPRGNQRWPRVAPRVAVPTSRATRPHAAAQSHPRTSASRPIRVGTLRADGLSQRAYVQARKPGPRLHPSRPASAF